MPYRYIAVENIVRKETLLLITLYSTYFPFEMHFEMLSAIFFYLDQS